MRKMLEKGRTWRRAFTYLYPKSILQIWHFARGDAIFTVIQTPCSSNLHLCSENFAQSLAVLHSRQRFTGSSVEFITCRPASHFMSSTAPQCENQYAYRTVPLNAQPRYEKSWFMQIQNCCFPLQPVLQFVIFSSIVYGLVHHDIHRANLHCIMSTIDYSGPHLHQAEEHSRIVLLLRSQQNNYNILNLSF